MTLARRLFGGAELLTASGSLSGSGTLAIAPGAILVTLTGRGGTGGDNSWYDPGQPYIAPTAGQPYIAPYLYWSAGSYSTSGPYSTDLGLPTSNPGPGGAPSYEYQTTQGVWQSGSPPSVTQHIQGYTALLNPGQPYIAPHPGQPYIAPSSGGGVYSGGNTTAELNGVTRTWTGGYGGVATESTQTLDSTGAGQTLTYSIASGGTLSYTYQY